MNTRSYAILGTRALDGYYCGNLARAGLDVPFLFNSGYEHARKHGLVVESAPGDFELPQINAHARAAGYDAPVLEILYHQLKTLEP